VADDDTARRHTSSGKDALLLVSEYAIGVGDDGRACCHGGMSRRKQQLMLITSNDGSSRNNLDKAGLHARFADAIGKLTYK
jgi:hypothetical protein